MKRFMLALSLVVMLLALLGANIRQNDLSKNQLVIPKKKCLGYTIVEFGKGIDCNGDTVKLARVNGVQVLAETIE